MATEPGILTRTVEGMASIKPISAPQSPATGWQSWFAGVKKLRNRLAAGINRMGLEYSNFTVISNDCWGKALYDELGLPCQTPLAVTGMHAECFLRFLTDIPGYLNSPLKFAPTSLHASINRLRMRREHWPIATLRDEVEIHFWHFTTEEESRRAWDEGLAKVNLDRLVVKFTVDKYGAVPEHAAQFDRLPFARKLLLSEHAHPGIQCAVQVPNFVVNGDMMYRRSLRHFDCAHWLNTGEIRRRTPRVMANKLLYLRGV